MKLVCFVHDTCCDNRGRCWSRITTVREEPGRVWSHHCDMSLELGRRLAEKMAERHGVADLAGLHRGMIMRPTR